MDRILNLVLYDMARLTRCDLSGQRQKGRLTHTIVFKTSFFMAKEKWYI